MNRLFNITAQRAIRFRGPAVICGDFNLSMDKLEAWQALLAAGWQDAAVISSEKNHHDLEATSCESARHSFILINPTLCRALIQCRTTHHHMFPTHPVLTATFNLECILRPVNLWKLPRSFDMYLHDPDVAQFHAASLLDPSQQKIQQRIQEGDVNGLAVDWTRVSECTLAHASVKCDGTHERISKAHFGRATKNPLCQQHVMIPLTRKARDGDYQPLQSQCSVVLRQHCRQLHRLQSLVRQITAIHRSYNLAAWNQACHLWLVIVQARGFHFSFANWIHEHVCEISPYGMPSLETLILIRDTFHEWHTKNERAAWLRKTNLRRLDLIQNLSEGGKLAFDAVRDEPAKPLTTIARTVTCKVRRTRWTRGGRTTLHGGPFRQLDVNLPITFQEQTVFLSTVDEDRLTLASPVLLKSTDETMMIVTQKHRIVDHDEMHQALFDSWNPFFKRDDPTETEHAPADIVDLINQLPDMPIAHFEPIDAKDVQLALSNTKKRSARGSDGFSTRDLMKLPPTLVQLLAILLNLIESTGCWPDSWCLAKTQCLPKCDNPQSPLQVRPVTVMAKIYRLWGRIRGKQIAAHIITLIPPEVGGPCQKVAADMIALHAAKQLEDSYVHGAQLCGAVFDIMKCYNCVHRGGLLYLFRKLGIGAAPLNAFEAMMNQMQRFWEVSQNCSSLDHTTTGIIEGCGVAVPAMLAIGILVYFLMLQQVPQCKCLFFADNLSFTASCTDTLKAGIDALVAITDTLRLTIAPTKSWVWGNSTKMRSALRTFRVNGESIPVTLQAKDLGVQQSYCRKRFVGVLKGRIQKSKSRLNIIKKAKVPRSCTKRLAVSAALPVASYGMALSNVHGRDFHNLRVSAARAVRRSGAGANAFLACCAVDRNLDPELNIIKSRFQIWKRFAALFPSMMDNFHEMCIYLQDLPNLRRIPGPVAAFVGSLVQLGCRFVTDKFWISLGARTFNWMRTSFKTIKLFLDEVWVRHVCSTRIHRKFFDLPTFDQAATSSAYNKLSYLDKALIDTWFTGRNCTNDFFVKYVPDTTAECTMCGEPDSRYHRVFECRCLQHIRDKYKNLIQQIQRWPETCWQFGLCPLDETYIDHWIELTHSCPVFSVPESSDCVRYVFTDGCAHFGDTPGLAVASSAWVECGWLSISTRNTARALVPGVEQSSFTGEMHAILMVLNSFWRVEIFTDCDAVFKLLQAALNAQDPDVVQHPCQHLWQPILQHLKLRPSGYVTVRKVKAHVDPRTCTDEFSAWCAWANGFADEQAKKVFSIDYKVQWSILDRCHAQRGRNKQLIYAFFQMIALFNHHALKLHGKSRTEWTRAPFDPTTLVEFSIIGHTAPRPVELRNEVLLSFPWGSIFCWRLLWWLNQLEWPRGQNEHADISFIELLVDFQMATGTTVPFNASSRQERAKFGYNNFILHDLSDDVAAGPRSLAQQSDLWVRCLMWINQWSKQKLFHGTVIGRSFSLAKLGCTLWYKGLSCRPKLVTGFKPAEILRRYFITATGTMRNCSRILQLPATAKLVPCAPLDLDRPFQERIALIRRSKDIWSTN
eukprot:Skav214813  [mRNA]  locus=scaffold1934:75726:80366:+ [translate_table: standard]